MYKQKGEEGAILVRMNICASLKQRYFAKYSTTRIISSSVAIECGKSVQQACTVSYRNKKQYTSI